MTSQECVYSSDSDDTSVDVETGGNYHRKNDESLRSIRATLTSEEYDAATIRAEFRTYQSILPKPDKMLQQQHSVDVLREMMFNNDLELPRWIQHCERGIKPHDALCCLLLKEMDTKDEEDVLLNGSSSRPNNNHVSWWLVRILSLGWFYPSINIPADIIREQFHRVAHVIPTELVRPSVLRKKMRNESLPIPNFFLDPEDDKQFPPHIAMLVILQDGEQESKHLGGVLYRLAWLLFAALALVLRLVLEVIGGAGAIWGGAEVFNLRNDDNRELWRWISVAVGILCYLRFVTLNAPQQEDQGDLLGPAGPWSLRPPARLRAVCEHPFHYFARAQPSYSQQPMKKNK